MSIVILAGILITVVTMIPVVLQMRNHPKGLVVLFFAEMWERFSYYGMRGILIAYLTQHFLFERPFAGSIYGAYTSLVYLLPLIGGYLADKYLGTRKAIAFGALLLVAGHGLMAVEQKPAVQTLTYQGQTYQFESVGRIDQRQSWLVVDGKRYDYATKEGLSFAAGGPFPERISSDQYKIEKDGAGEALIYGEQRFSVVREDEALRISGNGASTVASPLKWLEIKDLPPGGALPAVIPAADYAIGVTGQDPVFVAILYLSLALIAMGVGFLKANISTIVGQLYQEDDPRRDSGFTLYYYGINLGAFWAGIACVYYGMTVGWWLGFGLAGIGMLAGFVVFVLGKGWLEGKGEPPEPQALKEKGFLGLNRETLIYLGGIFGVFLVFGLMQANSAVRTLLDGWIDTATKASIAAQKAAGVAAADIKPDIGLGLTLADFFVVVGVVLVIGSVAVLGYIGSYMASKCTKVERERLWLALILIAASVVFWTLFEQAGTSLNLFAQDTTDLRLFGGPVDLGFAYISTPAEYAAASFPPGQAPFWIDATFGAGNAQSFNSGFILFFAPVFAAMWAFLESRKLDPNDPMKFALALVQVGAGFLVLVWGANFAGPDVRVPLIFLVLAYLLHTTGELFLSPVGLSMVTKLSPAAVGSTMMAVWFLSSAWAQWIGAVVAALTATETIGGAVADSPASRQVALDAYLGVFSTIGWVAIGLGVALGLFSFWLNKLAHREH